MGQLLRLTKEEYPKQVSTFLTFWAFQALQTVWIDPSRQVSITEIMLKSFGFTIYQHIENLSEKHNRHGISGFHPDIYIKPE